MPPHTSEAPITADLGLGDYKSLPVFNQPSPNARHDADSIHVKKQTFRSESLDMDEKERKAGLLVEDKKLVIEANGKLLEMRSDRVKAAAKLHVQMAVLVRPTFIKLPYLFIYSPKLFFPAALNIVSTQFMAREIPGFSEIPALAVVAADFFSFSSSAFYVLSAVFILAYARTLFIKVNEVNAVHKVKFNVVRDVVLSDTSRLLGSGDIPDDVLRLRIMGDLLAINFTGFILCFAGVFFSLVSSFILMIATKPMVESVPMMAPFPVVATTIWFWVKLQSRGVYVWEH
jgi:hypothetical protein